MKTITEHKLRTMLSEAYDKGREHGRQEEMEEYIPTHGDKVFERHTEKTKMLNKMTEVVQ